VIDEDHPSSALTQEVAEDEENPNFVEEISRPCSKESNRGARKGKISTVFAPFVYISCLYYNKSVF
jgi:hypothetical protein